MRQEREVLAEKNESKQAETQYNWLQKEVGDRNERLVLVT